MECTSEVANELRNRTMKSKLKLTVIRLLERFRFGFQYLNRYLNFSLNQSDVSDLPYKPIKLFKNREKVVVVVEEVKSEPLYWCMTTFNNSNNLLKLSFHAYKMNPDPNPNPNPNRDDPNNLLDAKILLGYNVRIECKFTKLLKPVYSVLRQLGHTSSPYIDDSYLLGDDYYSCLTNFIDTIRLIYYLGFLIHPGKSVATSPDSMFNILRLHLRFSPYANLHDAR